MSLNILHNRTFKKTSHAFTVIELLTSIFIVAVLVTILSVIFNIGIRSYRQADEIVEIANKAQRFLGQISAELAGATVSKETLSTPFKDIPFDGDKASIYFMAPWDNSTDIELCEFGYKLSGTDLQRRFITSNSDKFQYPDNITVFEDDSWDDYIESVKSLTIRYKGEGDDWEAEDDGWDSTEHDDKLPQLVEIKIEMDDTRGVTYSFTTRVFLTGSTKKIS